MKKLVSLSAVLGAMLMLASGSVLAQGHGRGHGHGNGNDRGNDRYERDDGDRGRGRDDDGYRHVRYDNDDDQGRGHGRGHAYGHYKNWHDRGRHEGWYRRGGYLPVEYRSTRYVVYDWRRDHLREPPRGYHWVRSDNGDFLLVAIATGVIVDLLLNQ
ncbi:MAG: RcnB family protein [Rhodanobacter sp.]|uniref:RcnB family protein n=1 Tax=Rhodanobacter sp. KK11 TaxID=3083255 RepID=UPI0029674B5B|nr:RcnB family protein [Rhodanobacter sp. KK11]MDW2980913.1 RcnB family protein [Rhodanobacter sp. KK11]